MLFEFNYIFDKQIRVQRLSHKFPFAFCNQHKLFSYEKRRYIITWLSCAYCINILLHLNNLRLCMLHYLCIHNVRVHNQIKASHIPHLTAAHANYVHMQLNAQFIILFYCNAYSNIYVCRQINAISGISLYIQTFIWFKCSRIKGEHHIWNKFSLAKIHYGAGLFWSGIRIISIKD